MKRNDWFATFTFLDLSGAISSSQLRGIARMIGNVWRRIVRSASDRSKCRVVGV